MLTSTLIEELALEFGENPQELDVVGALLGFVRDAIQEVNLAGEWQHTKLSYSFETDASVSAVSLPEAVAEIIAIQRTSTGRPLTYVDLETLTNGQLILANEGEPAYWNYKNQTDGVPTLRLYPTPDDGYTYVVYYESHEHDLATEDSTLSLPHSFIPVLKHGIREMYYAAAQDSRQADRYNKKYRDGIATLRSRHEHIRRDEQGLQRNDIDGTTQWPTPQFPTNYPRIG